MGVKKTKNTLTKQMTYTAILTALYLVLSAFLKIPVAGHISVDLGYIALMVGAVCLGAVPAMLIGSIGVALESMIMSARGLSIGWVAMNAIIGYICGLVLGKVSDDNKKAYIAAAIISVVASTLLGVCVKTLIDCAIYNLTIIVKIPTAIAAWVLDSAVMLAGGLPLSLELKKRIKSTF